MEATCHTISTRVLATQSRVSALNIPLQDIHSTVSGLETRFDTLEALIAQVLPPRPARDAISQQVGRAFLGYYAFKLTVSFRSPLQSLPDASWESLAS